MDSVIYHLNVLLKAFIVLKKAGENGSGRQS